MKKKGFTLIELLIVIAIIGILVGFSAINLIGVRGRARDGERKSDVRTIQSAFELFKADRRSYPNTTTYNGIGCNGPFSAFGSTYANTFPCDPLDNATKYVYTPSPGSCSDALGAANSCTSYTLRACLENANDADKDLTDACADPSSVSYTVQNP